MVPGLEIASLLPDSARVSEESNNKKESTHAMSAHVRERPELLWAFTNVRAHWSRSADSTVTERKRSLLLDDLEEYTNSSERLRIRSATVESAERDHCVCVCSSLLDCLLTRVLNLEKHCRTRALNKVTTWPMKMNKSIKLKICVYNGSSDSYAIGNYNYNRLFSSYSTVIG